LIIPFFLTVPSTIPRYEDNAEVNDLRLKVRINRVCYDLMDLDKPVMHKKEIPIEGLRGISFNCFYLGKWW